MSGADDDHVEMFGELHEVLFYRAERKPFTAET